ncbi:hypothetical protein GCM10011409_33460 [Lentibacillus populi]|uniref:Uncharacterized protein n=1 Tax=Lentibacillus populi TaxID=1827502 RepID=A0A9W5TZX6_9BACI|nr:hypothetical protein GCM10011409_33460 [Lentibacillus populi]
MIEQNTQNEQLPNEVKSVFAELNVIKHLYKAGINKTKGFSTSYLFIFVFSQSRISWQKSVSILRQQER